MIFKITLFALIFISNIDIATCQIVRPIGTNLSGVSDYSTELVFTDAFKQAREWISFENRNGAPWDSKIPIPTNENGYPLEIPYNDGVNPEQSARALILWAGYDYIPHGKYRLIVKGTGVIRLNFSAKGTYNCPIDTLVTVQKGNSGVALEIIQSLKTDPINNIEFIYPKYVNDYKNKTFTDEFLSYINDFQVIRFMDWLRTNNSNVKYWSDRTLKSHFSQSMENGVSWEYIVELCNTANKDLWLCVPHKATDGYMDTLAVFLKSNLNPDLKIYLEYSNEVWNNGFAQHKGCATLATEAGITGQEWERAWKFTAKRSADLFHIFEQHYPNSDKIVKLIPSQAANTWLSNQLITFFNDPFFNPNQVTADAIVIAPYFGGQIANNIVKSGIVNEVTTENIIDSLKLSLATSFNYMTETDAIASNNGLSLIAYEGGSHLVATNANVNDTTLTRKLIEANRHEAFQEIICEYMNFWYDSLSSKELFAYFSSTSQPSKWGSWGLKESMSDTLNPKYLGIKNCVISYNTPSTNVENNKSSPAIDVQYLLNQSVLIRTSIHNPELEIYDILGSKVNYQLINKANSEFEISIQQKGVYIIRISNGIENVSKLIYR